MNATALLHSAIDILTERGMQRDQPDGERSMPAVVDAFNALTGHTLTEQQGWMLLALVKIKRSQTGRPDPDHYVDGANYLALAGEAALRSEPRPMRYPTTPAAAYALSDTGELRRPDGSGHNIFDVPAGSCPICRGTGSARDDRYDMCPTCAGTGAEV